MADRTLQVVQRDTDQKVFQSSITYANPTASFTDLKTFVQSCVGLTTNTYVDAYCVDKTSLNEATA